MTRFAWLPLALIGFGCDALVGGECADGYGHDGRRCIPASMLAGRTGPAGGGAGANATPAGASGTGGASSGAGGTDPAGTTSAGGASGTGGHGTGGAAGHGASTGTAGGQCLVPLTLCGSACVDLDRDPYHCGNCFHACPTGLCEDGDCQGGTPGHVVVIGMSFEEATPASRHLLGNAIFLPLHEPLRVLELRGAADSAAFAEVHTTIDAQALARGRVAQTEVVDDAVSASARLGDEPFDLFLIHDQPGVSESSMTSTALDLAPGLAAHGHRGGTVVVLAASPAMATFLRDGDLLDVASIVPVTGDTLTNTQPSSALGLHVPSPFFASSVTSRLDLALGETAEVVVTQVDGDAVAVHKTVP